MQIDTSQDRIVAAASLLFRQKGYHETSIEDIADFCCIKSTYIYYAFKDKEDIANAVMDHVQHYFDTNIFIFAYDNTMAAHARIIKINAMIEKFFTIDNSGCVFINFAIETINTIPAFINKIKMYFQSCINAYREVFATTYTIAEAQILAEGFVADLQGALIMMRVTGTNWPLRRLSARLVQALHASG